MILSSFSEILSLGIMLPFLGALADPHKAVSLINKIICCKYVIKDINYNSLLVILTLCFIFTVLLAIAIRFLLMFAMTRLGHGIGADFSLEIFRRTLYLPYGIHCSRNSSDVIAAISSKVNVVVYSILVPMLTIASSIFLIIAIIGTLFLIQPYAALIAFISFGTIYALTMKLSHKKLDQLSITINRESGAVIKVLQESMGGIRDILINGSQNNFLQYYVNADLPLRRSLSLSQIIGSAPRYGIEALGVIVLAVVALQLALQSEGILGAIPILGAMALGAQKLLPIMQNCFSSWTQIQSGKHAFVDVIGMLTQPISDSLGSEKGVKFNFSSEIVFSNVSFKYISSENLVLDQINFEIKCGEKVGIVGESGGGKSTLADLLMGLLIPTAGNIYIDGDKLTSHNTKYFQKLIAHVPQDIFMMDGTIAENIAFGIADSDIDNSLIKESARKARLAEIETWAGAYNTPVGERGILLSGGQKQRIGIARALYKQARIIIFDEATSALDHETEKSVIDSMHDLPKDITLILIAHRLTTLELCDHILEVQGGKVIGYSGYQAYMNKLKLGKGV